MKKLMGFTLIELLITIVIVGILASIAIPTYTSYILKSHRIDAKNALSAVQLAEEKYRGNNLTYTSTLSDLGLSAASPQGYYTIAIANDASDSSYTATASVDTTSAQAKDVTACPTLTLTQAGFVSDQYASCWGLN
jgi:type IV pilus assembly protein PilE